MKTKYFETLDCRRTYSAGGLNFNFTQWGLLAGVPQGVYKTEDPQEIAALEALNSESKSGVWEIDEERYNLRLGIKKSNAPMNWSTFDSTRNPTPSPTPAPQERIKPTVDRSSIPQPAPKAEEAPVEVKPVASTEEAIKTGKTQVVVSPPPPQVSVKTKGQK